MSWATFLLRSSGRSAERIAGFTSLREYVARLYELFLRERLEPDYLDAGGAEQATWMATH